jgi:hypothetical protein
MVVWNYLLTPTSCSCFDQLLRIQLFSYDMLVPAICLYQLIPEPSAAL